MNKKYNMKNIGIALVLGLFGLHSAEANSDWAEWKQEINQIIADEMEAPKLRSGQAGTMQTVEFEILHDGRIENIIYKALPGDTAYDIATKKTMRKISKLPPLPTAYKGRKVQVKLDLVYAVDEREASKVIRRYRKNRPVETQHASASPGHEKIYLIAMR